MDSGTVPWQEPSKLYVFLISQSFLDKSYPNSFSIYLLIISLPPPVLARNIAYAVASAPFIPSGWLCVTSDDSLAAFLVSSIVS